MSPEMPSTRRSLPLSGHRVVTTSRTDEAAEFIGRALLPTKISRIADPRHFRLDMNGRHTGKIFFGFNQFATDTELDAGQVEDKVCIGLGYHHNRPSYFELDDACVPASIQSAAVISPGRSVHIRRPAGSGVIALGMTQSILSDRYQEITGARARGPIVFEPAVDLTKGPGSLLFRIVHDLASAFDRERTGTSPTLLTAVLQDSLISVVLGLSSQLGAAMEDHRGPGFDPRVVRLAEDYMAAHVGDPITLSDLVTLCGCGRSALYNSFKSSREYTPMQFLALRRLELAHKRLIGEPGATVTAIAHDCGFTNLGRFAKAYRERFDEAPSATRARGHGSMRH